MKPGKFLSEYGALIALVLLFLFNAATKGSTFLQVENLRNLVSQNAAVGIIAIGMTLVIIAGGIDLSVGSLSALCGAIAILVVNKMASGGSGPVVVIGVAILVSLLAGLAVGMVNGVVVAYGRVAPFVVTLAGMAGFRSLALVLGDGGEIRSSFQDYQVLGLGGLPIPFFKDAQGHPITLYWSAIVFFIAAIAAGILLNRTRFGRYVVAVGANRRAATYSGIDTRLVTLAVYGLLGACVGIASLLVSSRMNSVGTGSVGNYYELDAIAAVVIGGTSLSGGKGRIWGTVVGVLLLTLIGYMITAYQINSNWQGLVKGAVILIAVLIQRGRNEDE